MLVVCVTLRPIAVEVLKMAHAVPPVNLSALTIPLIGWIERAHDFFHRREGADSAIYAA